MKDRDAASFAGRIRQVATAVAEAAVKGFDRMIEATLPEPVLAPVRVRDRRHSR